MLRYREQLGLLAPARRRNGYRVYSDRDLAAAALAAELEASYEVSPAALGFALRALEEPQVAAQLRELGRLAGRAPAVPLAALDFDQHKAQRLLRLAS